MVRILQVTDSHLFSDTNQDFLGIKPFETFKAVMQLVEENLAQYPADLILFTGDLSQDFSEASYQNFLSVVDHLPCKMVWIPGNHDDVSVAQKVLEGSSVTHEKVLDLDHWRLILLNTNWPKHVAGQLTQEELSLLSQSLQDSLGQEVLVFLHHHPIALECSWIDDSMLTNDQAFLEIIRQYHNVRAVIFGHVHSEHRWKQESIEFMSCPATSFQFLTSENDFKFEAAMPGFRWFNLLKTGEFETGVERVKFNEQFVPDLQSKGYD